jgi:hypothetical protein
MDIDFNLITFFKYFVVYAIVRSIVDFVGDKIAMYIDLNKSSKFFYYLFTTNDNKQDFSLVKLLFVIHKVFRINYLTDISEQFITKVEAFPSSPCSDMQEILNQLKSKGLKEIKKQSQKLKIDISTIRFETLFDDNISKILLSKNLICSYWAFPFQTMCVASFGGVHTLLVYKDCINSITTFIQRSESKYINEQEQLKAFILLASKLLPTAESEQDFYQQMFDFVKKHPKCNYLYYSTSDFDSAIDLDSFDPEESIDAKVVAFQLIKNYFVTISDQLQRCN